MPPARPASPRLKDLFASRLAARQDRLSPGPKAVATFIDQNRHAVLGLSALEIGLETGTSDATVIRTVQTLGFSGLRDLKDTLEAWLGQTDSPLEKMARTTQSLGDDSDASIDFVLDSQRQTMDALDQPENRAALATAVRLLQAARGFGLFGIGASGGIAQYAARLFTRSGLPSYALNATGISLAEQMLMMQPGHCLMMFLHGRPHREAMAVITEAERLEIPVLLALGTADSPLFSHGAACFLLPRARKEAVALHFPSMILAETLHLAYSAAHPEQSVQTLDRLVTLRTAIRPHSR